jgi:hypothetical protein
MICMSSWQLHVHAASLSGSATYAHANSRLWIDFPSVILHVRLHVQPGLGMQNATQVLPPATV